MANVIGSAIIKTRTVRKQGNKEVSQSFGTIIMEPEEMDEDDWKMRQMVAWIILQWGWDW
jgi:hypothetical protein